jgi:excisionase family DNA binding protein
MLYIVGQWGGKMRQDLDELMDIRQAAALLLVSETSLRRWTNAGRLPCLRVGLRRERRFRRSDLIGFMEQPHRHAAATEAVIGGIPVALGSHFCSLYGSDVGRTQQAVGFLADGLEPGSACFLVSQPEARHPILAQLEERRPSLRADIDEGRLVLSEYADSAGAQCEFWEARLVAAARSGTRSLRVVGDVSSGPQCHGWRTSEVVDYERLYDQRIAKRFPVVTLCQYDARLLSGGDVAGILACHADEFAYPAPRLIS